MKIKIFSRVDGYRRAGIRHSRRGQVFTVADLTEDQLQALDDDPHLRIVPVTVEDEEGGPAEPGPDGSNPPPPVTKVKAPSRKAGA